MPFKRHTSGASIMAQWLKLLEMPPSNISTIWSNCLLMLLGRQVLMIAQVLGPLAIHVRDPVRVSGSWPPGFSLAHPWLLWQFGK